VIISNHVIEHVGDEAQQKHHLSEIGRLLAPGAVAYLAYPNRWSIIEPHYQLAFLSWLPVSMRSAYLRFFRQATHYDCRPLSYFESVRFFRDAAFSFQYLGTPALRLFRSIENRSGWLFWLIDRIPDRALDALRPIIPTLIFTLRRKN